MPNGFRLAALICCLLVGAGSALAERRVALVIGNSAYQHTRALSNAGNDAAAVAKLLGQINFDEVSLRADLDYRAMREAVRQFGDSVREADIALFYFAGHGIELAGENYLVPVDAKLARGNDLEYEAVTLGSILAATSAARKLKLVVLDACRNNPLGERMALRAGATRSVTRGLARIEPKGDVLVAYAAKAGTLAQDGTGRHSPYTAALLEHIATPGLDVLRMFGRVKEAVLRATGAEQEPWIYGSPGGEVIALVPGKMDASSEPDMADRLEWVRATAANRLDAYRAYIRASPTGKFVTQARARIDELERLAALWEDLKTSRSLPRLRSFADEARASEFGAVAAVRVQHLEAVEARDWEQAERTQRLAGYQAFISTWPDGFRAEVGRRKITELEGIKTEWARLKTSDDEEAIEAFVLQYGWTEFGAEATAQLVALRRARAKPDSEGVKTLTAQEMRRLIDNAAIAIQGSGEIIRFSSQSMPTWRKSLGMDFLKREMKKVAEVATEGAFASKAGAHSIEGVGAVVQSKVDKTGSLYLLQMHGTESNSKDVDRKDRMYKVLHIVKDAFGYVCIATGWHSSLATTKPLKIPERCAVETMH